MNMTDLIHPARAIVAASLLLAGVASAKQGYTDHTATTQAVADRYAQAYFDKDWETLETLADDSIHFSDPTAVPVFGEPPPRSGKAVLMQSFRRDYAALRMRFDSLRSMYSGEYAFYEGTLAWDLSLPGREIHSKVPMIVMLRVVDGKVAAHTDFVDYRPFIEAERTTRSEQPDADQE